MADKTPEGELVILDFEGATAINGSYIKTTAFWLFLCGQFSAKRGFPDVPIRHPSDPRPFDVFVAVANMQEDVREEIVDFYRARRFPILIATKWNESVITDATLDGHLDPALKTTLAALIQAGGASAPQLHQSYPDEGITVTAWNNRLADLSLLRLVKRSRKGKQWEYKPIAERIDYGRKLY